MGLRIMSCALRFATLSESIQNLRCIWSITSSVKDQLGIAAIVTICHLFERYKATVYSLRDTSTPFLRERHAMSGKYF